MNKETLKLTADTIRILSAEAVQKANSGHPGMPMGMAELAAVLWTKYLKHNPEDPSWISRDRFVLSNGHGSMLIYSMLHLSGYELSIEDIKNFRQVDSITPGHPESFITKGVETTTGPLGQGIGNAVGMAIGQKSLAARYCTEHCNDLFEHKVWCFTGDGCLMEGVSAESSSLAGHLGLNNLIVVYDDNNISIAGETELAFTENVKQRYESYGWKVLEIDGHDLEQIDAAYAEAISEIEKPVFIAAKTSIGKGSPNKQGKESSHGSPLGLDELKATKENIGWSYEEEFFVPEEVKTSFASRAEELKQEYQNWNESYSAWTSKENELADQLKKQLCNVVPEDLWKEIYASMTKDATATRKLSQSALQVISANVGSLIGGSADLEPSNLTLIKDSEDIQKNKFVGKNIRFGVREHAMGAIANGLAYYGGFIPYGSTFLCFLDYMKPAVRLAALSELQALYIYTHDSIFLGEDGPTHQPVEHVAMLRMIPNLNTYRPADALETALCYQSALNKQDGPSAMILTRQTLPVIDRDDSFDASEILNGAYEVTKEKNPEYVIVATGSEVGLALDVASELGKARVVSMPCVEIFNSQSKEFKENLIPKNAKKILIEAGTSFGWASITGADALMVTVDTFGTSAPLVQIKKKYGFTKQQILEKIKEHNFS